MKILKYTYKLVDFPELDDWIMDEIDLQTLNLIVGKNATGKSRILIIPTAFAGMITQYKPVYFGNWEFTFITSDNKKIYYRINNVKTIKEKLIINEKVVLERNGETTKIYSQSKQNFEKITPPDDKLVLHVRRDKEDYPFLEHLVEWAENTHAFKFGQIHPGSFLGSDKLEEKLVTIEDIPVLIAELSDKARRIIIEDFNTLGYNIEKLYTRPEGKKDILYVREKGLKHELRQSRLSQGMFRALALLVFIYYLIDKNKAKTIIIDDLCEGLDYERATRLGNLLFEKLQKHDIQLIASSNDSFLMDVVKIRYWNILKRKNNTIKVYNYKNSKEKFDNFKYSGLSNFDLFASDYLD